MSSPAQPNWLKQRSALDWVGIAVIGCVLFFSATASGVGGIFIMAGIIALGLGIYVAITGRRTMFGFTGGRKFGLAVTGAGLVASFVGGGIYGSSNDVDPRGCQMVCVPGQS
ncbi:MAG: hypothetical protein ACTHXA_13135 [Gulosibacter sp.]|uniref:hypothetical protein n=1 Tax=Gulosibacter sp. TaxID=2817531 RepID=UPI003F9217AD